MPATKQIIREVRHTPPGGLEEQRWLINLALLVMAGMVAVWIFVMVPFVAGVWWRSAWTWLATLAVSVAAMMGVTSLVSERIARRYQFAAVVSIFVHVAILLTLLTISVPVPKNPPDQLTLDKKIPVIEVAQSPSATNTPPRANVLIMNSSRTEAAAVDLTTQAPVETAPAAPAVAVESVPRSPGVAKPSVDTTKPELPGATLPETKAATPLQIARAANESATVARRSDTLSQLSRHTPQQPKPDASAAELPRLTPQKSDSGPKADAAVQEIKRQVAPAIAVKQPVDTASTAIKPPEPAQVASLTRREETPQPDSSSAPLPTLPKKLNTPSQLPHTEAISEATSKIEATPDAPLQPGGLTPGKQTASPFVGKPVPNVPLATTEPGQAGAANAPGLPLRIASSDTGPQVARNDAAKIARAGKATGAALGIAIDAPAAPLGAAAAASASGKDVPVALQPAPGQIGRGNNSAPGNTGSGLPSGNGETGENALAAVSPLTQLARNAGGSPGKPGGDGPALGASSIASGGSVRRPGATTAPGGIATASAEGLIIGGDGPTTGGPGANDKKAGGLQPGGGALAKKSNGKGQPGTGGGQDAGGAASAAAGPLQLSLNLGSGGRPGGSDLPRSGGFGAATPSLGGGNGSARAGRPGPANGLVADALAEAGLPGGKGDGGTGGDGTTKGPGQLQAGATALNRGVPGGLPGGTGGDIAGTGAGLGPGGELGGAIVPSLARAGMVGGDSATGAASGNRASPARRNGPVGGGPAGANGGSAAETAAQELSAPSPVASDGTGEGGLIGVRGGPAKKQATGVPGENLSLPFGAAEGTGTLDSVVVAEPGNGIGARKNDNAVGDGPILGNIAGRAPSRRGTASSAGTGTAEPIDESAAALTGPSGNGGKGYGGNGPGGLQPGQGTLVRRGNSGGGVVTAAAAEEGAGGLGTDLGTNVGLPLQMAKNDAVQVSSDAARFPVAKKSGGPLALDPRARDTAEGFSGRLGSNPANDVPGLGGKPGGAGGKPGVRGDADTRTESAIEAGLKFLAKQQAADGSWSLHKFPAASKGDVGSMRSDTAATGLALLSFLGAGYDHFEEKYRPQVTAGILFLIKHQQDDGDLYISGGGSSDVPHLYSHAIGTLALCEALGMTGDENLRAPAQKAIDFIVKSQSKEWGGWRYRPGTDSDTSVLGWQLTALRSGDYAGLKVPAVTFERAAAWLDLAQASKNDASQYVYNPLVKPSEYVYVDESGKRWSREAGTKPSSTMTSVGLLMRLYLGWDRTNPNVVRGAEHLRQHLPALGRSGENQRDTYYWYYATQVMYHMGGDYWKAWNDRLHPLLISSQAASGPLAGSWDPNGAVPDRWGGVGGRIYVTTMNLLSLEVVYRHLPLYKSTAK